MASVRLKQNSGYCEIGGRMIFLDICRDRYLMIAPTLESIIRAACAGDIIDEEQRLSLIKSGLFENSSGPQSSIGPTHNVQPVHSVTASRSPINGGLRFYLLCVQAIFCLSTFYLTVKRIPLRSSLSIARAMARILPTNYLKSDENLQMAAFGRAALLFRRDDCCLPTALALYSFQKARFPTMKIVFGIQTNPFQAHCWVQREDVVLGQDVEDVQAFRPILATS